MGFYAAVFGDLETLDLGGEGKRLGRAPPYLALLVGPPLVELVFLTRDMSVGR
jgi:hypothetical protein